MSEAHRLRNLLATVRTVVRRSTSSSPDLETLSMHLDGRLDALGRLQIVIGRAGNEGVYLEEIVRGELLAHAAEEERAHVEGPEVLLTAKEAEVIGLAVHELAANAVKFGALSTPTGRVAIAWSVAQKDQTRRVRFSWVETGVEGIASTPPHSGFGFELIQDRVAYELDGEGRVEFHPGGIHVLIEFPHRSVSSA
jgi:two-component sensor histidine kinase